MELSAIITHSKHPDLTFFIITRRPDDWGDGYDNVVTGCSYEGQYMADRRLLVFLKLPVKHKRIVLEPLLQAVNLESGTASMC